MADAKLCDRCGEIASKRGILARGNSSLKYKSVHSPNTFIGSRNRSLDLCTECRRKLDAFLGLGQEPHEIEGYGDGE